MVLEYQDRQQHDRRKPCPTLDVQAQLYGPRAHDDLVDVRVHVPLVWGVRSLLFALEICPQSVPYGHEGYEYVHLAVRAGAQPGQERGAPVAVLLGTPLREQLDDDALCELLGAHDGGATPGQ